MENKIRTITEKILLFFAFSMIGWAWEVIYHLAEEHIVVNRGFLYGPWLPIYGTGGVLILIYLKKYLDRPVLLFFMIMGPDKEEILVPNLNQT